MEMRPRRAVAGGAKAFQKSTETRWGAPRLRSEFVRCHEVRREIRLVLERRQEPCCGGKRPRGRNQGPDDRGVMQRSRPDGSDRACGSGHHGDEFLRTPSYDVTQIFFFKQKTAYEI